MSITQNASRVRVESAAKNGTLGSQSGLGTKQIKLDTNISTNNGNLESTPTLKWRHILLRKGLSTEECQLVQSVEADGVTCNCYNDWDTAPASGDAYHVSYELQDLATIAGCDFETDSRQYVMSKKLVIATGSVFAYLGLSHGQILRLQDSGNLDNAFEINNAGRFEIGTIKNDKAERGGILIFTNDADDEEIMVWNNGSVGRLYEFALLSARSSEGVTGLTITVGATADVEWGRVQTHGISSPFTYRYERFKDIKAEYYLTKADLKNAPFWDGWLKSELDKTVFDALTSDADTVGVRILVEG